MVKGSSSVFLLAVRRVRSPDQERQGGVERKHLLPAAAADRQHRAAGDHEAGGGQ
jgi:hypothetical protein